VTYNATLNQGISNAGGGRVPEVNLVQMDWFSALNVIIANPAAYGFTDVLHQCFGTQNAT